MYPYPLLCATALMGHCKDTEDVAFMPPTFPFIFRPTGLHATLLCTLTQMSHLPGKNRSGMRAAYRAAPVIYKEAMSASQPICPIVAALRSPSEMTKCRVGMTPLRPRARNTPGDKERGSQPWQKWSQFRIPNTETGLYCRPLKKKHNQANQMCMYCQSPRLEKYN